MREMPEIEERKKVRETYARKVREPRKAINDRQARNAKRKRK